MAYLTYNSATSKYPIRGFSNPNKVASPDASLPVITEGLVSLYDSSNPVSYPGSGTTLFNLSTSGDATLENGVTFDNADSGALVLYGTDDYLSLPAFSPALESFSFMGWFKINTTSANQCFFAIGEYFTAGQGWAETYTLTDGTFIFRVANGIDGNLFQLNSDPTTLPLNTWFYVCAVFDNTLNTNANKLFYNENVLDSITNPTTITSLGNVGNSIGRRSNASLFLNGKVGLTAFYNRALSDVEVLDNYNSTKGNYGF